MLAGQEVHRIADFERIAGGARQRLVHVGDQRRRSSMPGAVGDRDEALAPVRAICPSVGMKAPEPVFTSRISAWSPAASFFDRIDAVISDTILDRRRSRRGSNREVLSAGARSAVWPMMAQPASLVTLRNSALSGCVV